MTPDGKILQKFMDSYISRYPDLGYKWASLIGNAGDTSTSIIASTQTALKPLSNPKIARMTANHTIDFKQFRQKKTILYLTFPAHEAQFYTFILNIFYTQFFNECMKSLPTKNDLPIFILYDEFGHGNIPYFDMIATNIRKYKVSLSIVLQSVSQLEAQYGKEKAKTIIEGGIGSKLFYPGSSLQTAEEIQRLLGKVIRDTYSHSNDTKGTTKGAFNRQEFNLLNADEIRTLKDNEALFITGNKKPVLLKTKAYFENNRYKRKIKYGEAMIPVNMNYVSRLATVFDYL
jgi:type IV secretory pathway TraG/TraD family ATPase VirD4